MTSMQMTMQELCLTEAKKIYGDDLPRLVNARLKKEFVYICNEAYAELLMMARKLVKGSNEMGYMVGFRGTIGASFAAYLLGITKINPLCPHYVCFNCKHTEFIENGEYICGADMPVKKCPVCGAELKVDGFDIPAETFFGLNGDKRPDINLNVASEYYLYIYQNHRKLLSNRFVYKAGRMAKDTLKEKTAPAYASIQCVQNEEYKIDIVCHCNIEELALLEKMTKVHVKDIPLNDEKVMDCFTKAQTLGIDEFSTSFVRNMLKLTKPMSFSELVKISGLSHGTDAWLNNAQDFIKSGTAVLSEVIGLRDDIMLYLMKNGTERETAYNIMEDVRKGKGLTDEYEAVMREHEVHDWYIASCKKIKYLFPKAHAAIYVMYEVCLAYFKVYYPAQFYAAHLKICAGEGAVRRLKCGKEAIQKELDALRRKNGGIEQNNKHAYTMLALYAEIYERGLEREVLKWMEDMDWND